MKKPILAVMAILMMFSSTIPSYAAVIEAGAGKSATTSQEESTAQEATESTTQEETKSYSANVDPSINWILNPDDYKTYEHDGYSWWQMEGVEQARRWAEENKGDVENIADEKERYTAIVKKVCDFLTYDLNYVQPHIAYTIRDGKGVCGDYTSLTKALCDATNIQAQVSDGIAYGDRHDMLKVTLNGHEYYSDPTGVDSGACDILLDGTPSYYTETTIHDDLLSATITTGDSASRDSDTVKQINAPEGKFRVGYMGVDYWLSKEDSDAWDIAVSSRDMDAFFALCSKYGIPVSR